MTRDVFRYSRHDSTPQQIMSMKISMRSGVCFVDVASVTGPNPLVVFEGQPIFINVFREGTERTGVICTRVPDYVPSTKEAP